jgi:hypothetical protein
MINTLDNQKLKKGAIVWGIGVQLKPKKVYKPYRAVVHSSKYNLANPYEGYADFDNAQKECDKLNKNVSK